MQTVNFQCGHCGKLMGVSAEHLGQQVRCPSCQQVVLAPASGGPAPVSSAPPTQHGAADLSDDIFHTPSDTDDALFGPDKGPKPEIHLPPATLPPTPEPPAPTPSPMTFAAAAE